MYSRNNNRRGSSGSFTEEIKLDFSPSVKQYQALALLWDRTTNFVGYGGAAFSGKSYLMCNWLVANCLVYPDTAWGLGRRELTTLKKTTLVTFFKVCDDAGMAEGKDYRYNQQLNVVTFRNRSKVYLIDTAYKPSDPLYQRFGGYELTGCAVDESAETEEQAIQILFTRCGRRYNQKYGLAAKMLETFNPNRNHVYRRYYRPWADGTMQQTYAFVRALPTDNPSPEVADYVRGIVENADRQTVERLIHGNFEYAEDDAMLIGHADIDAMFDRPVDRNALSKVPRHERYITVDPARKGEDATAIIVWYGWTAVARRRMPVSRVNEVVDEVSRLMGEHGVDSRNVCVDTDGVGGGVADYLPGCLEFVNNARPYRGENFENAKSQCYYRLAKEIGTVSFPDATAQEREQVREELSWVRAKALLAEGKKGVVPKDHVKKMIGRSPDWSDAMMMRCAFEYRGSGGDVYFA